jgi:hypothetical protein
VPRSLCDGAGEHADFFFAVPLYVLLFCFARHACATATLKLAFQLMMSHSAATTSHRSVSCCLHCGLRSLQQPCVRLFRIVDGGLEGLESVAHFVSVMRPWPQ